MSLTIKTHAKRRSRIQKYLWPAAAVLCAASSAKSEGFRNQTIGTSDLGRSGGRIAQVDDPTAVQQNPANIVGITNVQAELTPSAVYYKINYKSNASSDSATTEHPWKLLPNAFASVPLIKDKIAAGIGVSVPYGLANQWNQSTTAFQSPTSFRYTAPYYSSLVTINLNPTVSFRLLDCLSVGVGLDAMWSEVTLKQIYPNFLFPGSSGESLFRGDGDGWGWGGNLGLTWNITEHQRFAVTYRSPMDVDYSGHFTTDNVSPTEAFLGVTSSSSFGTTIKFPTIVGAGYGIDLTDTIRLETDFEWLEFSRFKSLNINAGNDSVLLGSSANIPESWHNTFTAGIGGDWKFAEHWVLRGSYQFFESPVPNSTFSPTIPDANQNVVTIGIGWSGKHNSLEAAYGLDFYSDRHITNDQQPAFNGTYSFNVHLFSLAYSYSF